MYCPHSIWTVRQITGGVDKFMEYEELKRLMSEQKEEMTAAERMKAYNAGEEVDYIPYTLQAPDPAMADIFGFTTTQFAKDFEVKSEVIRRRKEEFGLDSFNVGLCGSAADCGACLSLES